MFETYAATISRETAKPGVPAEVTHEMFLREIREQVANPTGPVHITGHHGDGKVAGLRHVLDEAGLNVTHIVVPITENLDLTLMQFGLPVPTADGKGVEYLQPTDGSRIKDDSVLIIDGYEQRHPALTDEVLLALAADPRIRQVFVVTSES